VTRNVQCPWVPNFQIISQNYRNRI
jgi:hypothetical protein